MDLQVHSPIFSGRHGGANSVGGRSAGLVHGLVRSEALSPACSAFSGGVAAGGAGLSSNDFPIALRRSARKIGHYLVAGLSLEGILPVLEHFRCGTSSHIRGRRRARQAHHIHLGASTGLCRPSHSFPQPLPTGSQLARDLSQPGRWGSAGADGESFPFSQTRCRRLRPDQLADAFRNR